MDVRFHCEKPKGHKEDLTAGEYKDLRASAAAVFAQPTLYEWE